MACGVFLCLDIIKGSIGLSPPPVFTAFDGLTIGGVFFFLGTVFGSVG